MRRSLRCGSTISCCSLRRSLRCGSTSSGPKEYAIFARGGIGGAGPSARSGGGGCICNGFGTVAEVGGSPDGPLEGCSSLGDVRPEGPADDKGTVNGGSVE
jgi:hypothetical protein